MPFGIATSLGLGAVALRTNPSFPGYPNFLTAAEVSAGLPAPAAAAALLGKTGASLMLVLLFRKSACTTAVPVHDAENTATLKTVAVTSATSAEMVAVSSIGAYDVYKRCGKP